METQTDPHANNQNTVVSGPGAELAGTTLAPPTPTPPPRAAVPATSTSGRAALLLLLAMAGVLVLRRLAR